MGTGRRTQEGLNLENRLIWGRGFSAPSPTSYYVILLATGLALSQSSTAANLASGEVAASNGYARQVLGLPFTVDAAANTLLCNSHGYANNTRLNLVTTNTLPGGLSAATDYFVVNATANNFQVSATQGGSAIDITGTGTGTHFMRAAVVFDSGSDKRAEAIEDKVIFTANSSGDIIYQGYAILANTTATRGDSTNAISIGYEYFAGSQIIPANGSQLIPIRTYNSDQGANVGI